jgi:hypothetical protein
MHKGANMPPNEVKEVFKVMSESEKPKSSKNFVEEGTIADSVCMA